MEMRLIYTITATMKTFKHKNIVISQNFYWIFKFVKLVRK